MTLNSQNTVADSKSEPSTAAPLPNPAVARCLQAFHVAHNAARQQGIERYKCVGAGCDAYRDLMPPLDSYENIRDFIACVTRGLVLDSLSFRDGHELLYAAQVAVSALRSQPKEPKPLGRPKGAKSKTEESKAA